MSEKVLGFKEKDMMFSLKGNINIHGSKLVPVVSVEEYNMLEESIFDALNTARATINPPVEFANKEKVSYGNHILDLIESIVDFEKIKKSQVAKK